MNEKPAALSNLATIDAAHHLHPFNDTKKLNEAGVRIIERAEGVHIWDATGKKYLDAFGGLWCVNVGYGRKSIADAAYAQMQELPYYNTFFGSTTPPATLLAQKVTSLAGPQMNHVFFTNSGSEATDTWFRLARVYWKALGHPTKTQVIARKNGYHGSTVAGASLGGMKYMHEQGNLPIEGIHHINQPYWYGEGGTLSPDEFGLKAAQELEAKILELGAENVAAFVAEPVQGAGGVIIPPDSYWPEIVRICKHYDVLLVSDEVICGFGRLGSWFGYQHFGFEPDLAPIAKGLSSGYLPVGGVLVSDRVVEVLINEVGDFNHGYTYSGHPVCAAAALENIRILEEEKLVERVRDDIGPYFATALASLADHPCVGEVVSLGLIGAVQLTADKASRRRFAKPDDVGAQVRNQCVAGGVIVRATGDRMLFSPPFIISRAEVDQAVEVLGKALDWLRDTYRE
ncbi:MULTISPECIES: aspartate aminotransferase family protein [Rhizobium/Agrobacterium group]|uniref:Adenosylmethionine-8-amino-7-oxononanoate transaminase n=2 Tax=Rhizobium/Agrobacterium group TaxID=227290 RepID=B9JUL0_ALLAM|nr:MULTISPECIES: aspartate aminotransferase family protein [Rhizobium/Agrobacterium group]ACM36005.1 adenosylmethionine-8-amino-7-oxononanoate transaminase [Allorhizobium ampelinum S4]MCF1448196.1 aspartate aminotransferase family protein [Allorhizobium ampelinum]MUO29643.1 aminotransferase class III-fold pyridoxal phosphate-dependent enzyme [Agrobacterium vitis]MUO43956.1 aminotransferase class III-fold pyridoxal phosphate-dependent enzyme [Agrobacterium vitis]MUP11105.1 aminotransferase clas